MSFFRHVFVEEVDEVAGAEDFRGDDGVLAGDVEDVDGDGGAAEFFEAGVDGGVRAGFYRHAGRRCRGCS